MRKILEKMLEKRQDKRIKLEKIIHALKNLLEQEDLFPGFQEVEN